MFRIAAVIARCVSLVLLVLGSEVRADEMRPQVRGVLVRPERVTPECLAAWKARGTTAIVVPLDEATKPNWETIARDVEKAGMTLWAWVEVARNPALADSHPEWMAAIGSRHDDWRRRFPKAPASRPGEVVKAWPWVPIGYVPAFEAHRKRLEVLLGDLPGTWSGVFLNDLQAGPSSCGCGNDQCRWALDYGSPATAMKTPGDDGAARIVAELVKRYPDKAIVPVWVTECETVDLPDAQGGTGLCGGVACARGDCWPRYVRQWNPLLKATGGPIAVGLWPETFRRDPARWIETAVALFQKPQKGGTPLEPARTIAVVQAWDKPQADLDVIIDRLQRSGWVLALDPVDQSWEPRAVPIPR